ncbi:hypothetical protein QA601_10155 [Chitinispirillales bacterium ANBcel5]|uniref:hypothetical protein n=1 Tax=Cellulosispirillum alkaliphilum TaxID=3039283 RepID=UPI002A582888|nr:hypothetical protein [Chitinispirillales bacterium ANBcel5]
MGDAAINPTSLPLVILYDFYFVRKKQTEVIISINGRSHQLDELPIPIDWQKMTFARYSPKPLIATLNPEYNGLLKPLEIEMGQKIYEKGNCSYQIEWTDQIASIKSMCLKSDNHILTMSFTPSFPCLNTTMVNTRYKGFFEVCGHESAGNISGEYTVHSDKKNIHIRAVPSKGWKPKVTKFSTWFLFNVVNVFKKWPTTYRWDGQLQKNAEGSWYMQSKWIRTGQILKN